MNVGFWWGACCFALLCWAKLSQFSCVTCEPGLYWTEPNSSINIVLLLFNRQDNSISLVKACWNELFTLGLAQCSQVMNVATILTAFVNHLHNSLQQGKIHCYKSQNLYGWEHWLALLLIDRYWNKCIFLYSFCAFPFTCGNSSSLQGAFTPQSTLSQRVNRYTLTNSHN